MKKLFSVILLFSLSTLISGCSDSNDTAITAASAFACDNPILISSDDNQPVPGFIVYIDKSIDTKQVEAEFSEKYNDLTIFSSFPRNNSFYANINDETLMKIQCETDVIAIAEM